MFTKPRHGQPSDSTLFVGAYCLCRTAPSPRASSLDLNERDGVISGDDEIELAAAASPILVEDDPTALLIPTSSEGLALPSKFLPHMCHGNDST